MGKLAKFFENLARAIIDIARYFYGYFIDLTGIVGRALVNTLIGGTIMVLVGLAPMFPDRRY